MSWFKRILSVVDKPKKAVVRSERAPAVAVEGCWSRAC